MKNKERKRRIREMKREIERRGGQVMLSDSLPDEIRELFLREVLDCPECNHGFVDPFRASREGKEH